MNQPVWGGVFVKGGVLAIFRLQLPWMVLAPLLFFTSVSQAIGVEIPTTKIGLLFASTDAVPLDYLNVLGIPVHLINPWPLTASNNRFVQDGAFAGLSELDVQRAILQGVRQRYYEVNTGPLTELRVDFVLGKVSGPGTVNVAFGAYNFEGTSGTRWFGQSDYNEAFDHPTGGTMAAVAVDEIATISQPFNTFDKAINAIANVAAHEVGHMFGLHHVCAGPDCHSCVSSCAAATNPYDLMATGPSGLPESGWLLPNVFTTVPGTQTNGLSSVAHLTTNVGTRRLGDTDGDADVDSQDVLNLIGGWTGALDYGVGDGIWSAGDFDHDDDVDSNDILLLMAGWTGVMAEADTGSGIGADLWSTFPNGSAVMAQLDAATRWELERRLASEVVPEPSGLVLAGIAFLLLFSMARRVSSPV